MYLPFSALSSRNQRDTVRGGKQSMRYPTEFHTLDEGGTQRRNRAMRPRAWIVARVLHHVIEVWISLFDSNAIDFAHLFRCDCWNQKRRDRSGTPGA